MPQRAAEPLPPTALFPLGRTVMTCGIAALAEAGNLNPAPLIERHARGDWGDLSEGDAQMNADARDSGARLFSAYELPGDLRVWIITEGDRSATTVLLPEEY